MRDELFLLGTELSQLMIKKKTSLGEEQAINRLNPEEVKLEDEARMVLKRVFLNKNILRQIQYLDERIQ